MAIVATITHPTCPATPGYCAHDSWIDKARCDREWRMLSRKIFNGEIAKVLLGLQRTQHMFKPVLKHGGKIEPLLEFFNVVRAAHLLHADIMANDPATISVPEEFVEQRASIDGIRDRSLWDSTYHEACITTSVEAWAYIRAERLRTGHVAISIQDNDEWVSVGPPGPDAQPTVLERRWIVERRSSTPSGVGREDKKRHLRVERHRVREEDGAYIVEQEAYSTDRCEILVDINGLKRVPLSAALHEGAAVPPDVTVLDLASLPIVQLVNARYRGVPILRVGEHNLSIIDQCAASLSQMARLIAMHAAPKFRVGEKHVDEKTGAVNMSADVFVDPDAVIQPITVASQFDSMLEFLHMTTKWMMISTEMSPALMGMKMGDGSNPDTVDKLRLESTVTLAAAQRAESNHRPALERLWSVATYLESASAPAGGWPVAPVHIELNPAIPVSAQERNREQLELLAGGATSVDEVFRVIHGEERGPRLLAEKRAEDERSIARQQAALFGSVGSTNPFDAPSTGDQPTVESASNQPGSEVAA